MKKTSSVGKQIIHDDPFQAFFYQWTHEQQAPIFSTILHLIKIFWFYQYTLYVHWEF